MALNSGDVEDLAKTVRGVIDDILSSENNLDSDNQYEYQAFLNLLQCAAADLLSAHGHLSNIALRARI